MPISVVCSGCKTRFEVSEKFAGKQGPCPKCKAVIKIPELIPEVKVHAPEDFASGGKDRKGRAITKPIPRTDAKVRSGTIAAIIVGSVIALAVALVGGNLPSDEAKRVLSAIGLLLIGPPLAVGGYFALRDDELEPYQGKELWTRAALCGLGYAVLWGVYWYLRVQTGIPADMYQWVFVAPVFVAAGGGLALAAFDIDYGSGALHYCFYLIVALLLRAAIGLPPLWVATLANAT